MLAIKAALMPGQRQQPLPVFMQLKDDCISRNDVVTAPLHDIRVVFAGALKEVEGAGVKVTPLLSTTSTGSVWTPGSPEELQFPSSDLIRRTVSDGVKPVMLACRITGKFRSNFPDGVDIEEKKEPAEPEEPAPDKPKEEPKLKHVTGVKEASSDGVVLVFADVDMIADILAYRDVIFGMAQIGDNASVVLNALDSLSDSNDLIAIRSRGKAGRPFEVVDKIERETESATADKVSEINDKIKGYQDRLRQLGASGEPGKETVVAGAALAERKNIEEEMRKAKKELRELNAGKRQRIESLGMGLETHNIVWAPAMVLLIAIFLAVLRYLRARRYVARRSS
jgi:ABC-type uncharacterized transport system involved in gliding motility auxiliary subunit